MIELKLHYQRDQFNLNVHLNLHNKINCFYGASGIGKTTLLHLIAGLINPQKGYIKVNDQVLFDSRNHINVPTHLRKIGYVFQEARLFPHLNVKDNLLYGFHKDTSKFQLNSIVKLLELDKLLGKNISEISGGEIQRVAIGRALLSSPNLLLLDEPLSSLDTRLKKQILPFIKRINEKLDIPIIYVSHQLDEIESLSDSVFEIA